MSDVPPPPGAVPPPPRSDRPVPPPPPPTLRPAPSDVPPGYVAYGNAPTTSVPLRRVRGLSKAVIALTAIAAIGTIVTTVLTASVRQDAIDFLSGEISEDQFEEAIGPLNAIQLITGLATFVTFVLTVIWMYRIASNVRAFQRRTSWSPLFAIFGWVLPPFVLYVIPFLMLRELWKASDPTDPDDTEGWRSSGDNPLIWAWFVLYGLIPIVLLAFSVSSFLDGGMSTTSLESLAETLDEFGVINVVSAAVTVAAAGVWILLVRQLTERHVALTHER